MSDPSPIWLICGGRNYVWGDRDFAYLDQLAAERGTPAQVIHGMATGADLLGASWAKAREIRIRGFRADWYRHGKAAGPLRNQQMLDEGKPTLVIAFPGGTGTADMMHRARAAGVEVLEATHA